MLTCLGPCPSLCSIGTELTRDDRKKLYSNFGLLYPHGHNELSIAEDFDQIRAAMEKVPAYANVFTKVCMHMRHCYSYCYIVRAVPFSPQFTHVQCWGLRVSWSMGGGVMGCGVES
jgi:hypothetical protein